MPIEHHQADYYLHYGGHKSREGETTSLLEEIMAENLPHLRTTTTDLQIQDTQNFPYKMNPKRQTLIHTIIKCQKLKTRRESLKQKEKSNVFCTREPP